MTESVSVATFITETSTTDNTSSSIAEAAQELSENISEITLRNMQVYNTECTYKICSKYMYDNNANLRDYILNLSLSLGMSSVRAVGTTYDSGHN